DFVGVPSGAMDQLAAMLCTAGHALFVDTRTLSTRKVTLDPCADDSVFLLIDTRVRHELATSGYAARRRSCEEAARRIGVPALRDISLDDLEAALDKLGDEEL